MLNSIKQIAFEINTLLTLAGFVYFVKTINNVWENNSGNKEKKTSLEKLWKGLALTVLILMLIAVLALSGQYLREMECNIY
ncbi:MAG: hypothetical protein WC582_00910 [Patescibacteria group bacterium]